MLAVTESLPVGPREILRPPAGGGALHRFAAASSSPAAHWYPSARTAVQAALRDAGVDGEVLLPGYTCHAVDAAVSAVAEPVYVDVTEDCTIDLDAARDRVSTETGAVVPTHLYGIECEMAAVADFAAEDGLVVVEDAAQALSNLFVSEAVGTHADYTACSVRFYKEVTAKTGGVLLGPERETGPATPRLRDRTDLLGVWLFDRTLASLPGRLYEPLREHVLDPLARDADAPDSAPDPRNVDDWSDRLLAAQLDAVEDRVAARTHNAAVYDDVLPAAIDRPGSDRPGTHFRYPIRVPDGQRDTLLTRARRRGIGCSPMYAYTVSPDGACPTADRLAGEILHLPVHSGLSDDEVAQIAHTVTALWYGLE
jgi:dTDP-4-amino-4,6-dideoxygalactose transaminase